MCYINKENIDRFHFIKFYNIGTVKNTTEKIKEKQKL